MQSNIKVITGSKGYKTQIKTDAHSFIADEPDSVGGTNEGPNPYDFLLAALGSCTSMTLRMYADRKEWPLQEINVKLSHQKIHAKDCEDCESEKGYIDLIHRDISLSGDLTDDQKQRFIEIANMCPVHKTLMTENRIVTKLVS